MSVIGSAVDTALVWGLRALEIAWPVPDRLGAPLGSESSRRPGQGKNRRDPVILIGGFANSAAGWSEWKKSLELDGFDVHVIELPTRGLGDMYESAQYVSEFIAQVKAKTGASKVDLIGFSEGGLLARMTVAHYGRVNDVDQLITLATPNGGVPLGPLHDAIKAIPLLGEAIPESAAQLMTGSALLRMLDRSDAAIRKSGPVRYASVYAAGYDLFVTGKSGPLAGAKNYPINKKFLGINFGPNHFAMYHLSHAAYEAARGFLLLG